MKRLSIIFISISFILIGLSAMSQAQSTENVKRIKDFGFSLNKDSKQTNQNNPDNQPNTDTEQDTVRVETNLVVNDIMVLDKDFHSIKGLKKEDFIITEDNELQEVGTFSLGDDVTIPRSIVLIMDYSGSQLPYIKTSIEAAKVLVDKLNPKDKMAIVTDDVKLLADFTEDKVLLKKKLDSLKKDALMDKVGQSKQYSALLATLNEMFSNEDVRPIIILQTDGDELFGLKETPLNKLPPMPAIMSNKALKDFVPRNYSYDDICAAVVKSRATTYTINPGLSLIGVSPDEQLVRGRKMEFNLLSAEFARLDRLAEKLNPSQGLNNRPTLDPEGALNRMSKEVLMFKTQVRFMQQMALASIAKLSGGWNDYLEKPEMADQVYSRILSGINHRYVVGYYPKNEERNGKSRAVKIEIRDHPEYVVWGRKTYISR